MTRSSPAAAASDVSSDAIAATPRDAREGAREAASDARWSACESPIRPRSHSRQYYYGEAADGAVTRNIGGTLTDRRPAARPTGCSRGPPPCVRRPPPPGDRGLPAARVALADHPRATMPFDGANPDHVTAAMCAGASSGARAPPPRSTNRAGTSRHLTPRAGRGVFSLLPPFPIIP